MSLVQSLHSSRLVTSFDSRCKIKGEEIKGVGKGEGGGRPPAESKSEDAQLFTGQWLRVQAPSSWGLHGALTSRARGDQKPCPHLLSPFQLNFCPHWTGGRHPSSLLTTSGVTTAVSCRQGNHRCLHHMGYRSRPGQKVTPTHQQEPYRQDTPSSRAHHAHRCHRGDKRAGSCS